MNNLYKLISTPTNFYSSLSTPEKVIFLEEEIKEENGRNECIRRNQETVKFEAKIKANPDAFMPPGLKAIFKGVQS